MLPRPRDAYLSRRPPPRDFTNPLLRSDVEVITSQKDKDTQLPKPCTLPLRTRQPGDSRTFYYTVSISAKAACQDLCTAHGTAAVRAYAYNNKNTSGLSLPHASLIHQLLLYREVSGSLFCCGFFFRRLTWTRGAGR